MSDRRIDIRFAGLGGQGVVTAGALLGAAASLEGWKAAGSTTYGSQARGGTAYADVALSKEAIDFPHLEQADYLVVMSQESYDEYAKVVRPGGVILFDAFHVTPKTIDRVPQHGVAATRSAMDRFGNGQAANIVMLGALAALSGLVGFETLRETIRKEGNARFVESNLAALDIGIGLADGLKGETP